MPAGPIAGSTRPFRHDGVLMSRRRRMCGSLPKFGVIPRECPVEGRHLMIICPYPICNASWKSGLGRPVDLVRRRSLLREEGRGEVPKMSGPAVRCPVQVQVAFGAARCERIA